MLVHGSMCKKEKELTRRLGQKADNINFGDVPIEPNVLVI